VVHRFSDKYEDKCSNPITKSETALEISFTQNSTPSFLTMIENDKSCDKQGYIKNLKERLDQFKGDISKANKAF